MISLLVTLGILGVGDAEVGLERIDFFETKIRPVLATHCYKCHSAQAAKAQKLKGGLRLDFREGWERGGESGPVLVPGDPEASLLIGAIRYTDADLQMPPDGKLPASVIADFEAWVKMGAPDPRDEAAADKPARAAIDLEEARKFWAFQTPVEPVIPDVDGDDARFIRSPLDRLVLAPLLEAGLRPASPADRRTLIRRVTYDLTGLPPSSAEVESFVSDARLDAYERLVDRLLASPRHGERWGRHWLDVARYADSNGLDENLAYSHAFRYRDYVIRSFNADRPYDRMLLEQIAGDLLVDEPGADVNEVRIATGFLSLGPKMLACDDGRKMQLDIVDEQVDTVCRATMALTMSCARCHDHKFDPLSTEDYYALAGIFKSTKTMENFKVVAQWHEYEVATEEERERLRRHQEEEKAKEREQEKIRRRALDAFLATERSRAARYLVAAARFVREGGLALPDGEASLGDDVLAEGLGDRVGVLREAEEYTRGTLVKDTTNWGKGFVAAALDVGVLA